MNSFDVFVVKGFTEVWTIFTSSPFKIGDIGDVRANLYNTPKACEEITQQYREIFKKKTIHRNFSSTDIFFLILVS